MINTTLYILMGLILLFSIYLFLEDNKNKSNRKKLDHVIHINGIRGKSTVTRLIHAGIRGGGFNVFAKTTGTLPMTIDINNNEELIKRKGKANIKEQINILAKSVTNGANILAVECMAVNPILQNVSQHKILKADIGVITNIRLDHTEEMGNTLEEICESISNTIPKDGYLVTSEEVFFSKLEKRCEELNTKIIKAIPKEEYKTINFTENVACAVEVCKLLGIDKETALKGMNDFIRDPYDLRIYKLKSGAIFINGLSINDPDSSEKVYREIFEEYNFKDKNLNLLINNRPDRGYRANHMVELSNRINPQKIIIMGSFTKVLDKKLKNFDREIVNDYKDIDFNNYSEKDVIYAVGNIANAGDKLLEKVRNEGVEYV